VYETRLRAEEEQRDTISRDLHDGVGQMLAYLNIYFNILKEKSRIEISDIEKVQITLRKTIDEIRRISRNLAPPAIKQLGFKEAVMELINSYAIILKPAFHLKMYKSDDPTQFLYEHKIMIFRILQELSSNTFKYAKAKNVNINIEISRKEMKLCYMDDGIGFDTRTTRKGIGLKSMLSRVEFYGGMISIVSEPNKGMAVEVNLPFD
jgi:signal transduction histidine kinase